MRLLPPIVLAGLVAACTLRSPVPSAPAPDAIALSPALAAAFEEEAHGDPTAAAARYLDLLDRAAASRPDAWQIALTAAALDALVFRRVSALASVTPDAALVYRTEDPSLTRGESLGAEEHATDGIAARLARAFAHARGPFARGLIAEAMTAVAEHRGDVDAASRWREASGCAREATVVGPLDWAPVTGVQAPDVLAPYDAPLAAGYAGPGGFATVSPPVIERGRACSVELAAQSSRAGVRDVVVDVDVDRDQRIGVALRSAATATLRAGGKVVIDRPYDLGGGGVSRFAWVDARAGRLRLVARAGMDQDAESVRISAWDEAGRPLRLRAPRPGEAATVEVRAGEEVALPTAHEHVELLGVALAALAMQDPRTAEHVLESAATQADAPPDLALAYGRAVESAIDLSRVRRTERARAAYERVLAAWPDAWEAVLGHAWLAGVARGPSGASFAQIEDLSALRGRAGDRAAPMLDVLELAASGSQHLWDRAREAEARLQAKLARSALFAAVEREAFERSPADLAVYDCAAHPGAPRPRGGLACYSSLHARGDLRGAVEELERLRAVLGGVDLFLPLTLRDALSLGDSGRVERAMRDMLPAEVTLSGVYGLATLDPSSGTPASETRERLRAVMTVARDAPMAIGTLLHALRDDPTAPFAGIAESAVHEDRARPVLPDAATAILRHTERYDVTRAGIVHAVLFDLRRVSGTTDVEDNAQAPAPSFVGRSWLGVLRRRVLKHDGTVIEPDPNPGASQGHAELAQMEAGDIVEAIYEGWAVPADTGENGFDTVDLLPARTAVHDATIEVHLPTGLSVSLWSHPALGPVHEETNADERVLRWALRDHDARRLEYGTPRMDRSVAVSLTTATWSEVARGLREAVAERLDRDPEVVLWARQVAEKAHATSDREKVDAVVAAVGAVVKQGDAQSFGDHRYLASSAGPQSTTARGTLADHEGSRTWLVVRALRELGVPCDVVVAESEPFSASPDFPPHSYRFVHPLAIAHVRADAAAGAVDAPRVELPIDADVPGPPLPEGHVSPELRGRQALHEDGTIAALSESGTRDEEDEIDERLAVDSRGDARGTFTILLRGRDAEQLADALEVTVGDARRRTLRDAVLAWVPFVNVDSIELSSGESSWQVAIRADVTVPGYAQPEGRPTTQGTAWVLPGLDPVHHVYPRRSSSTLSTTYASEGTRQSALAVSHAVQYHVRRRVTLPPGARVVRTPGPFHVTTAPLTASRSIVVHPEAGAAVEDDLTLDVPTGTIPPEAYAPFAADAHRTDDAFLATTRFVAPAASSGHAP